MRCSEAGNRGDGKIIKQQLEVERDDPEDPRISTTVRLSQSSLLVQGSFVRFGSRSTANTIGRSSLCWKSECVGDCALGNTRPCVHLACAQPTRCMVSPLRSLSCIGPGGSGKQLTNNRRCQRRPRLPQKIHSSSLRSYQQHARPTAAARVVVHSFRT